MITIIFEAHGTTYDYVRLILADTLDNELHFKVKFELL